jgi:nucleoside-diphosphate-sugar epimerase
MGDPLKLSKPYTSPDEAAMARASRVAFVTGGTGFLGLNLIAQLVDGGWDITALHRPSSDLTHLRRHPVRLVAGSVEDRDSVRQAMPERVDAVFHLAGDLNLWSRRNAQQTQCNVEGTRNVVEAALERRAGRLLHTSTIAVYGLQDQPVIETSPRLGERSSVNYFRTKALAEAEVHRGIERGLDAVILNPANIVGPYDRANWSRLFRLVAEGKLPGIPPGRGSFCHVAAVARAHVAAVDRGRSGENYLLGGTDASYLDVLRIVGELIGRPVGTRPVPALVLHAVGWVSHWASYLTNQAPDVTPEVATMLCVSLLCRSDKAIRELGYRPVPLRVMLEDCHRWLVESGQLRAA